MSKQLGFAGNWSRIAVDVGRVYPGPVDIKAQYGENGLDAIYFLEQFRKLKGLKRNATNHLWFEFDQANDTVSIIDTGIGMVGDAPKGCKPWEGKRELADLTEEERTFLQSFERMVRSIGLSSKKFISIPDVKGVKGVGVLSVFQIAAQVLFVSRPYPGFAPNYLGKGRDANQYVYTLSASLKDDLLSTNDANLDFWEDYSLLKNPITHEPLEHGTRVTMTNLFEGVWEKLEPKQFALTLSKRFSRTLREGKVTIEIVVKNNDQTTEVITVNPPEWPGERIYSNILRFPSPWEEYIAPIELYYDPEKPPKDPVMIQRKGGEASALQNLPELANIHVFDGLGGFVGYPEIPERESKGKTPEKDDEGEWATNKTQLANTKLRQVWIKLLIREIPTIKRARDQVDGLLNSQGAMVDADELRIALLKALDELPQLTGARIGSLQPPTEKKGKKRTEEIKLPDPYLRVTVMDEFGRGVGDIPVELYANINENKIDKLIESKKTSRSGYIYYGSRPTGWYTLRILPPAGITPVREPHVTFQIKRDEGTGLPIGRSMVFVVHTEKPRYPEVPELTIGFQAFRNHPDLPYDQQLDFGKFDINVLAPDYAEAFRKGDTVLLLMLRALYMACAVTEYRTVKGEMGPEQATYQVSILFPKIYKHLIANRKKKQKRS